VGFPGVPYSIEDLPNRFLAMTVALMVYRIYKIRQRLKHKSNSTTFTPLTNIMRLLIESGLLYTSTIVILFILYMLSNNGQYPVSDVVSQFASLSYIFILIDFQVVQIIVRLLPVLHQSLITAN
jgi:hypothetical protein